MARKSLICLCSLVAACFGCTSGPSAVADPSIEAEALERRRLAAETEARLGAPERLLTDFDKTLDKYAQYRLSGGPTRNDALAEKIGAFLHEQAAEHFDVLVHEANSVEYPRNRAIAVAALGFSGRIEALDPILNAVRDEHDEVVTNAMLGLAILRDPRTPPEVIAGVIESPEYVATTRAGAAWALFEIQQVVVDQTPILAIWQRVLDGPIDEDPASVVVSALRGVGYARDPARADALLRYVSHPVPLVRTAAAIALGRAGNDDAVAALIALIGTGETNENVKLAARKALQALAGGVDRGYDVRAWKRVFDRGA